MFSSPSFSFSCIFYIKSHFIAAKLNGLVIEITFLQGPNDVLCMYVCFVLKTVKIRYE